MGHSKLRRDSNNDFNEQSSLLKLPMIESSPDLITSQMEKQSMSNVRTNLPTLCLNKGWSNPNMTLHSEVLKDLTRIQDHQNSTTITSKRIGNSNITTPQSFLKDHNHLIDNPFKAFKDTEKLLYTYENRKKAGEEAYVSPLQVSLAVKSFKPREGKVREFSDIEALHEPERITKKRLAKSQSAAALKNNHN